MDKKTAFLTNFIQEELYVINSKAEDDIPLKPLVVTESEIDSQQTSFLQKIFSAVGLGPTDFEHQVSSDLPAVEHPVVFYFGSSFQDNPPYTLITTDSGQQRVYAHSLELIQQDQDQKRALWQILKEVF
jgi:hypothetical protein